MGKIMQYGVELSGSSSSADRIKYDETKNVKEAIDELGNNLELDYSNASVKDLKSFLQATLNRLFALVLNLVATGVWNSDYPVEEFVGTGSYATEGSYFVTRSSSGGYRTVSKIDLTSYKKITFIGKCNTVDDSHGVSVGVCNISDVANFITYGTYTTSESTVVIDVSSLSGEYYVGLNNYNTVAYTKSIVLE